jgi:hypothetical protein
MLFSNREVLVPAEPFQPSPIFAGKAEPRPYGAPLGEVLVQAVASAEKAC